jgi:hypothetical protein
VVTKQQGWIVVGLLAVAIVVAFVIWKTGQPPAHKWTDDLQF